MHFRQVLESEKELSDKSISAPVDPEHLVNFAEGNLNTDTRQETDKDSARQEIGKKTQTKDAGQEKYAASQESDQTRECNISRCTGGEGQRRQPRPHHGGGCGVGADDKMARRAEDCEDQDGQKKRVESGDHRCADDLCVTHDFGYTKGCKGDASHDVRADS